MGDMMGYLFGLVIAFIIGVFLTRWIFGIETIIRNLEKQTDFLGKQNQQSLIQIRLLKKMLLNQGSSHAELDEIIEKGNQIKEEPKSFAEKFEKTL